MSEPCPGGICGFLFGHLFMPRYHVEESEIYEPPAYVFVQTTGQPVPGESRKETYVCDVCVRCGVVVGKQEKP